MSVLNVTHLNSAFIFKSTSGLFVWFGQFGMVRSVKFNILTKVIVNVKIQLLLIIFDVN